MTSGTAVCDETFALGSSRSHLMSFKILQGEEFTVGVCTPEFDPYGLDLYVHHTLHGWGWSSRGTQPYAAGDTVGLLLEYECLGARWWVYGFKNGRYAGTMLSSADAPSGGSFENAKLKFFVNLGLPISKANVGWFFYVELVHQNA